jgi:hypothetical protein
MPGRIPARLAPLVFLLPILAIGACIVPRAYREPDARPRDAAGTAPAGSLEHDARMQWWREARFGLFIHWGLYAVPAGEWQGATDHGEWIRDTAQIPLAEYERFQAQFEPVRFDPDQWVALAREAGMRYLVITSKHHDGFALFDSAETDWDVMGTPFERDILANLEATPESPPCGPGKATLSAKPMRFEFLSATTAGDRTVRPGMPGAILGPMGPACHDGSFRISSGQVRLAIQPVKAECLWRLMAQRADHLHPLRASPTTPTHTKAGRAYLALAISRKQQLVRPGRRTTPQREAIAWQHVSRGSNRVAATARVLRA